MSFAIVDYSRPALGTGGQSYNLIFRNHSNNNWSLLCFQKQPSGLPQNYSTLAWFAFPVAPTTSVTFSWTIDYDLVWSQQGILGAGVVFNASQSWEANLDDTNQVTFTRRDNGAFTFQDQTQGPNAGALTIVQDDLIPANTAAVGMGMSGYGTFVVPAQPNVTATFVPTPQYWIAFGESIQRSEVLNISQFSETAQIKFPSAVYTAIATLGEDNKWTIVYDGGHTEMIRQLHSTARGLLR